MVKKNISFKKLHSLGKKLFPICRSITGPGLLETLYILKKFTNNLVIKKFKSRTKVYDWIVPDEWIINDAFVKDLRSQRKIINFKKIIFIS